MKLFIIIIPCLLLSVLVPAQTISPNVNTEFCPKTEYTFTITITKPFLNIVALGGATITQFPFMPVGTTFTIKGKFDDVNIKQTFKVNYQDNSSSVFEFKKIKSFFYGACSPIQPNKNSVTAELCKVVSFPINFNNISWTTALENPSFCFGSVLNYEYLLPQGWKLDTLTSTGNWIPADNNVTVTTDDTTGNETYIKIRPVNTQCASGLKEGQEATIFISRPPPPLSITGAATLCSPNSYTYTLNGVPAGASISWANTNSYYNLVPNGNTATVTPTAIANGSTTINASVTLICGPSFSTSTIVSLGPPYVTFNISDYPYENPSCYEVGGIYSFRAQQATGYPNTFDGFQWGWRNLTNNTSSNDPTIYGSDYTLIPEDQGTYEIWLRATNSCGTSTLESVKTIVVNNYCISGFRSSAINTISIYPNPAKNFINLTVTSNSKTVKQPTNNNIKLELYESITSKKVKEWKFLSNQNTFTLNIQGIRKGIYYLKFINGKDIKTQQVIVE
jgi:hypothetical protein